MAKVIAILNHKGGVGKQLLPSTLRQLCTLKRNECLLLIWMVKQT